MMSIIDIVERNWRSSEDIKCFRVYISQYGSRMGGIYEDGGPAYYTITQAVKNLVARWMLEITA
jgi:hypothetical protein